MNIGLIDKDVYRQGGQRILSGGGGEIFFMSQNFDFMRPFKHDLLKFGCKWLKSKANKGEGAGRGGRRLLAPLLCSPLNIDRYIDGYR